VSQTYDWPSFAHVEMLDHAAMSAIDERQAALDVLDRACAAGPIWSTLSWPPPRTGRIVHLDGTVGDAVMVILAADAVELFSGPTRLQLRDCLAPGCVLDVVKQHSDGNGARRPAAIRARVARHYRRHRVGGAAPSSSPIGSPFESQDHPANSRSSSTGSLR
jgi:predicted RNA-binding Zn ribbon-like protein